jgi:hypothetical protein
MIGWAGYAEVKMVKVLRRHSMDRSAIMRVIDAVHSIAATAGCHCRTREHKRKCDGSDNSEIRHHRLSFPYLIRI